MAQQSASTIVRVFVVMWFAAPAGCSQYHLAVAGGCAVNTTLETKLRTHPLPRGGTDCIQATSAEDVAFDAVRAATNAASSIAAAEEFFARFPHSNKRVSVARLVVNQLKTIRNPEIGITLINRARAIFMDPDELNFLQPIAVEIYANGNRNNLRNLRMYFCGRTYVA